MQISFGSKTLTETLQDEKKSVLTGSRPCGYRHILDDYDYYIQNIEKSPELAQTKIAKRISEGASAIVFETEGGDVLKLTKFRHYPFLRPQEDFDVPVKKHGKVGRIHYYIEEKLYQHNLNEGFVRIVKGMIRDKGYRVYDLSDFDTHQIGMSKDGKLYLLDPECARFKTIFHALYNKTKRLFKMLDTYVKPMGY
ncbi:hypothetical protein J6P92_02215 [bacterium]|nr:hypothetical protein [bacterium]